MERVRRLLLIQRTLAIANPTEPAVINATEAAQAAREKHWPVLIEEGNVQVALTMSPRAPGAKRKLMPSLATCIRELVISIK